MWYLARTLWFILQKKIERFDQGAKLQYNYNIYQTTVLM